jgi:hypothetical protein
MLRQCSGTRTLVACAFCACATSAHAQTTGNLGVGYSFMRLVEDEGLNLPGGFLVSYAQPLAGSAISIVSEGAGNYTTAYDDTLALHTFQSGVRFSSPADRTVTPFAQFLAGLINVGWSGKSANYFAIEPGGGVDIRVTGRVGLRVAGSLPMAISEGHVGNTFRFHVGVVLPVARH